MSLRGRVGVVTGAGAGIGREIACALAAEGMSLALIDRTGAGVRQLAEELTEEFGVPCFPSSTDLTDQAAIDRVVMHVEQHLGAVDLLVSDAELLIRALKPTMDARGHGQIITLGAASSPLTPREVVELAKA